MIITSNKLFLGVIIFIFFWILFYFLWYSQQMSGSFHFFNDATEWLYMDKLGHIYSSFVMSWLFIQFIVQTNQVLHWYTGICGFYFFLPVEIMDGFSAGYGFSVFDILANLIGSVAAYFQFVFFKKVIFLPKFSFWQSGLAQYRPELLGYDFLTQCFKDYNGQIYWINVSPNVIFKTNFFPSWLLFSVGYAATGMLGGHNNGEFSSIISDENRKSWIYFSLDIDLTSIKVKNKFLECIAMVLNFFKIPIYF